MPNNNIKPNSKDHRLILSHVEIPAREKWLFDNKTVLKKIERGIKDSAEERLSNRDSFSQYSDDETYKA